MASAGLPPYEQWRATCDTLHAHTQVLGKLAVVLAPPEPQLQHAALRLALAGTPRAHAHAGHGQGDRAGVSARTTAKQAAFRDAMRKLWEDHITWTRLAIVSFATTTPSTSTSS
ncbi:MAG: hypothetical protein HZB46_12000 [Solirubrobacterales bacterium]|nr:hypothetical protein [Solirubrobacterales bacterium]